MQWFSMPNASDSTRAAYPISFSTAFLQCIHCGNFISTQSGGATYNDLSMYTGYVQDAELTEFTYRGNSNPKFLFIGYQ